MRKGKKALLIVDIQNDFLPGGALAVPEGDQVIEVINQLQQERFDLIVACKDWHPKKHISFASTHPGKKVGESVQEQRLWPDHCLAGTSGADFPPQLHRERIAKVFYKGVEEGVDSYSAFFDNAHKRSTGLEDYLRQRGIEEIVIVGLTTDYCVRYSVLDARSLGFQVTVLTKACRGIEERSTREALQDMREAGAQVS